MKKTTTRALTGLFAIGFSVAIGGIPAKAQVSVLEIDAENIVSYATDMFDASKFATDPSLTTAAPVRNFRFVMAVGDIVAVNGKPAKGSLIARQQAVNLSPSPNPGQGMADVVRTAVTEFLFEIQQADGTPVGNVHSLTLSGGSGPVGFTGGTSLSGAPLEGNHVIVGGTGAFVGVRGQGASTVLLGNTGPRSASVTEDPAQRRKNGGGKVHFVYQLVPMIRPEIAATPSGPAVTHSNDFALVTSSNPAKAGEILSVFATGLGPTRPAVDPGKPFPSDPLAVVNSPVEVLVNGVGAEVIGAVGFPGGVDGYQVNFRVPADTAPGAAPIQLKAAWITGNEVKIAVQ